MKKIFALFLAIITIAAAVPAASAAESDYTFDVESYAEAVYLVNLDTGLVVYERGADERRSPASTTKIMSAALALELCAGDPETTMVTVPEDVWDEFEGISISSAGLEPGEQLSLYDLVHCMLLQSANEAASTVAAFFGGDEFIAKMNQKAAALGCANTHFTNPHGLYNEDHYTSARDMYKIAQWAMNVPGFYEISQKYYFTTDATNAHPDGISLSTTISLQNPNTYYYTSYIQGIKTGTIPQSGRCLVSTAEKDGKSYLLVLLGCPLETTSQVWADDSSVFNETRAIYDWAFENLRTVEVANTDTIVTEIELRYAREKDALVLYAGGELYSIVNAEFDGELPVTFEPNVPERVLAPVEAGDVVGTAKVYVDGRYIGDVDLISRESIDRNGFSMVMDILGDIFSSRIAQIILGLVFLVVLAYLYYIFVVVARQKKKKKQTRKRR